MEEEAKAAMAQQQQQHHHHQQQQAALQQQHQQAMQHQQQQHLLLLQQLQRQKQQQQQDVMTRFPSNIDAHLRPQHFLHRPMVNNPQSHQMPNSTSNNPNPNPNSNSTHHQMMVHNQTSNHHQPNPNNNNHTNNNNNNNSSSSNLQQQQQQLQLQQQQQQQKASRGNPAELQMAYQDAWRVCHPDFKRPFSSLEDACERLLPYHVVADYEAEEDDKILDSDTTGQMLSRSQQWDHNIAAKVAEFTATFEKQVLAFNIISRKRGLGEFRTEEKLMMEQLLLQEERRTLLEVRAEMDSRQKMGRESHEANMRIAAMAHAEQSRAESQSHSEMMGHTPIRASVYGSQGNNIPTGHDMSEQGQEVNPEMMINGWGNNTQRDEKEPSEDFLNDEETENGDIGMQSDWHGGGELDLNSR